MNQKNFPIRRMAMDAILIAMYFALEKLEIQAGPLKITFSSLAIVLCAAVFRPIDAFLVGTLGELLSQLLGPYGLTPTTALWVLPHSVRGLMLGFGLMAIRKWIAPEAPMGKKGQDWFLGLCLIASVVVSVLNTFTLYVDSKMFGYYSYALVFGALVARIGLGLVTSTLICFATIPVVKALRKAHLVI